MSNKKYKLKDLFDSEFMNTALNLYSFMPKNNYPELQQVLTTYKNKLKRTPRHSGKLKFGETFTQKIFYNNENFYLVSWSIPKVNKVIAKYEISLCRFALKEIISVVDHAGINKSHLEFARKNNSPIFIASYPPIKNKDKFLIIDGNHRVTSKYENGQETIPGYWLKPEQHIQAMRSELDRILFKIHSNYYMIASYLGGLISKKELDESLYLL